MSFVNVAVIAAQRRLQHKVREGEGIHESHAHGPELRIQRSYGPVGMIYTGSTGRFKRWHRQVPVKRARLFSRQLGIDQQNVQLLTNAVDAEKSGQCGQHFLLGRVSGEVLNGAAEGGEGDEVRVGTCGLDQVN